MALSNWDTFAMDHTGTPCLGTFISTKGVKVEIYKNWIFLKDQAWSKIGERYIVPYTMHLYTSRLRYSDVEVASLFVGQTIYMAVWEGYEDEDNTLPAFRGMIGIGTMGHHSDSKDYIGATEKQIAKLKKFLNTQTTTYSVNIPKTLANLDLSKGKRYNQGDMFFHNHLGLPSQCSTVGNAKETLFMQILKG